MVVLRSFGLLLAFAASTLVFSATGDDVDEGKQAWNFDADTPGRVPKRWSIRQTNPTKAMATWEVSADGGAPSKSNVLALTETHNHGGTFNLAVVEGTSFKDLDLTVKVKAVRGDEDQGGGPIWRCKNADNYYVCRLNPLEGNYRVYKVVNGRRKQLDTAEVETVPGKWYAVRVTMLSDRITCYLDGRKVLEAQDGTFGDACMVGLWTKADAVTSFDDLTVRRIESADIRSTEERVRPSQPTTRPELRHPD